MKKVSKLTILFLALFLIIGSATNVWAQNPVTINPGKSTGHFTDTVQEKISKFQEKMKSLSQSKFAQTIGKGVKKAKQAMNYAQEKVKKAKKFANQTKKDVLNSKAYKAAMLAKEAAEEGKKLKALEEAREKEISMMKEEMKIEKETLQAKLKEAEENCAVGSKIFAEAAEIPGGTEPTEDANEAIQQEMRSYKVNCENEINEIQKQIETIEPRIKKGEKDIDIKYAKEIIDEKDKIVEMTNKAKLLGESKEKKEEKTPQEEADETAELFIDKGPVSLKTEAENRKRRLNKVKEKVMDNINMAMAQTEQTEEVKEDQQSEAEISETMDGTSESMHIATQNLAAQLDRIYEVLKLDLTQIQSETYNQMSSTNMLSNVDTSTMVDLCMYSKQGCVSGDGIGGLKNMVASGVDKVKSVKEKAAEVKGKINQAKEAAQEAKSAVQEVKETMQEAKDVAKDVKNMTGAVNEESFSLGGML